MADAFSDTHNDRGSPAHRLPQAAGQPIQQGAVDARLAAVAPPAPCYPNSIRILRLPEVMDRVGLCRASIYLRVADGSFPKQISLGARAVGWLESEIDVWLQARILARENPKAIKSRSNNGVTT